MFINSWAYILFLVLVVGVATVRGIKNYRFLFIFFVNLFAYSILSFKHVPALFGYCGLTYLFAVIVKELELKNKAWFFIYSFVSLTVLGFFVKSFWLSYPLTEHFGAGVMIPLGFSYVCLQNIGFILDVKNEDYERFPSFLEFIVPATFFANIASGPIENILALKDKIASSSLTIEQVKLGFLRIATGFLKKAVSDSLITPLFFTETGHFLAYPTVAAIPGVLLKFYVDFSGYTDIAIGSAQVLGIVLPENFERPYSSLTMAEYWTRWHMTLGNWFKTYLFFPIQKWHLKRDGSTKAKTSTVTTVLLMLVFVLIGLWHGLTWNYLYWGFFNAALVAISPWLMQLGFDGPTKKYSLILFTLLCTFLGQLLLVSNSTSQFFKNFLAIFVKHDGFSQDRVWLFFGLSILLYLFNDYDRKLYQLSEPLSTKRYYVLMAVQLAFIVFFHKSGTTFLYADF